MEDIIGRRIGKKTIGFNAEANTAQKLSKGELYAKAEPEDLLEYGLIPELIGRLPVVTALNDLDEKALLTILTEPKNALVKQYQKLLELDSIKLIFEDAALEQVVKMSKARNTGARALRAIMEEVMLEIMYKLPSLTGVDTCTINEESVVKRTEPLLTFKKSKKTA